MRDPAQASKRAAQTVQELEDASQRRFREWVAEPPVVVPTGSHGDKPFDGGTEVITWRDIALPEEIRVLN